MPRLEINDGFLFQSRSALVVSFQSKYNGRTSGKLIALSQGADKDILEKIAQRRGCTASDILNIEMSFGGQTDASLLMVHYPK